MFASLPAHTGRFLVNARHAYVTGAAAAVRALAVTGRVLRRATIAVLETLERVLLSPVGRERVHASATFALIFLFALTSVDYLLSGGPEFNAPARASQPERVLRAVYEAAPAELAAAPEAAPAAVQQEETATALSPRMSEARGASVILVSQTFQPEPRRAEARPAAETRQAPDDLSGDTAAAEEQAPPRKELRMKAPPAADAEAL